jgi:hypothetical protein
MWSIESTRPVDYIYTSVGVWLVNKLISDHFLLDILFLNVFINNNHHHWYTHYGHVMPFILSMVHIYFDRLKFCELNDNLCFFRYGSKPRPLHQSMHTAIYLFKYCHQKVLITWEASAIVETKNNQRKMKSTQKLSILNSANMSPSSSMEIAILSDLQQPIAPNNHSNPLVLWKHIRT